MSPEVKKAFYAYAMDWKKENGNTVPTVHLDPEMYYYVVEQIGPSMTFSLAEMKGQTKATHLVGPITIYGVRVLLKDSSA